MKLFIRRPSQGFRLILVAIFSFVLMFLDSRNHFLASLDNIIYTFIYPLQISLNAPIQWFNNISEVFITKNKLLSENANLKAENFLLNAKLQKFTALEKENAELRALLKSTTEHHEHLQIAELISVNQMPFVQEFTLNQGKKDGAYVGQAVLAANGLVGQVIQTMPFSSKVLLITDSRSAIPIEDSHTGVRAILTGTGKTNRLELMNIPPGTSISPGDILVTSGLGGRFPVGYPVGMVTQITRISDAEFESIIVKPMVDVNRIRLMLLVAKQ